MALDAQVGWLATMTEPAGDYVEYHGQQNTELYIRQFRDRLKTLNRALREAGFDSHEEPDFSVLGPDPKCLNSVRLGFYSSTRDWFLDSLIAHLIVHRQVPTTIDDFRPDTGEVFCRTFAAFTPKKAANAQKQSCFAHPYFVGYGFSSVYVPQDLSVPLELDENENEVKYIGSSAALEKACSWILAACGYFGPWDDPVMDIKEGKVAEFEGLEPLEETPEWLVNTVTLVERLQRIAQRSLKTQSVITFS
jgi:hypothetical protein